MQSLPTVNPVVSLTNDADHTGKEGAAVAIASQEASLVSADDTLDVFGIIVDGRASGEQDSVAPLHTGATCKVRLTGTPGTVVIGSKLGTHTDGYHKLATSGNNAIAIALETGAANEIIDAILIKPELIA